MARPPKRDLLDSFIDQLADAVAARLGAQRAGARSGSRPRRRVDMSCRVVGCSNPSKGPRFRFLCEKHLKELSRKQQDAAVQEWKAKHAQ